MRRGMPRWLNLDCKFINIESWGRIAKSEFDIRLFSKKGGASSDSLSEKVKSRSRRAAARSVASPAWVGPAE